MCPLAVYSAWLLTAKNEAKMGGSHFLSGYCDQGKQSKANVHSSGAALHWRRPTTTSVMMEDSRRLARQVLIRRDASDPDPIDVSSRSRLPLPAWFERICLIGSELSWVFFVCDLFFVCPFWAFCFWAHFRGQTRLEAAAILQKPIPETKQKDLQVLKNRERGEKKPQS